MNDSTSNFPYFIYPVIKELETATDPERRRRLKAIIAANVYSPEFLANPVEGLDPRQLLDTPEEGEKSGNDLIIDSFIEKFGRPGQKETDAPLLPETAAPSNYFAAVEFGDASEADTPGEVTPAAPDDMAPDTEDSDDDIMMKKLQNMIKNGDFEGALSIINENYLNNPKKSIYFADQIRFIKKLMLNENKKNH